MLAHVFDEANERFTAHIGGFDLKFGNFVSKGNKYFISEVCEYKKNLDNFDADFAVCLNISTVIKTARSFATHISVF